MHGGLSFNRGVTLGQVVEKLGQRRGSYKRSGILLEAGVSSTLSHLADSHINTQTTNDEVVGIYMDMYY